MSRKKIPGPLIITIVAPGPETVHTNKGTYRRFASGQWQKCVDGHEYWVQDPQEKETAYQEFKRLHP